MKWYLSGLFIDKFSFLSHRLTSSSWAVLGNRPQSNGTLSSKGNRSRRRSAIVATKSSVARGARSK